MINEEKLALFMAVYTIELESAVRAYPGEYSFHISKVSDVAKGMTNAVVRGSFNKDGRAMKATFKAFGIKHTYKALQEFLTLKAKSITFAYSTSPDAKRYNKGNGCWLVRSGNDEPAVFDEHDKVKAIELFKSIDLPIDGLRSFTDKHFPEMSND